MNSILDRQSDVMRTSQIFQIGISSLPHARWNTVRREITQWNVTTQETKGNSDTQHYHSKNKIIFETNLQQHFTLRTQKCASNNRTIATEEYLQLIVNKVHAFQIARFIVWVNADWTILTWRSSYYHDELSNKVEKKGNGTAPLKEHYFS